MAAHEARVVGVAQAFDGARCMVFVDGADSVLTEVRCFELGARTMVRVVRWDRTGQGTISDEYQWFDDRNEAAERAAFHVANLGATS